MNESMIVVLGEEPKSRLSKKRTRSGEWGRVDNVGL
jgi:hypothetical protein